MKQRFIYIAHAILRFLHGRGVCKTWLAWVRAPWLVVNSGFPPANDGNDRHPGSPPFPGPGLPRVVVAALFPRVFVEFVCTYDGLDGYGSRCTNFKRNPPLPLSPVRAHFGLFGVPGITNFNYRLMRGSVCIVKIRSRGSGTETNPTTGPTLGRPGSWERREQLRSRGLQNIDQSAMRNNLKLAGSAYVRVLAKTRIIKQGHESEA